MKKYQKQNRSVLVGALVCVLISTVFAVALQFFKGDVLDYAVAGNTPMAMRYALLLLCFILGEVGFFYWYDRLSARFSTACARDLKEDVWASILRRGYVEYQTRTTGEYLAKYTTATDQIQSRRFELLPMLGEILFKVALVSGALFLLDWRLALITLFLLTTPLYVPKLIGKRLQRAQREYVGAVEACLSKVNDWLAGFEIIKNFSVEGKIMQRFRRVNGEAMAKLLEDKRTGILARLITTLISYLSYFIILVCATALVLAGEFTPGDFFVAIGMIDQLSYPLISLSGILRELVAIGPACREMEGFLQAGQSHAAGRSQDAGRSQPTEQSQTNRPGGMEKELRFHNVSFAYQKDKPLLRGLNLTIEKGKRYLLKGASGCGKTTAVNLLLRYFDPDQGEITLDGQPLCQFGDVYNLITVVRQEAVLFHDSLRNNLTMYGPAEDAALLSLLGRLGLQKYATPQALDETIAENGGNLSGGERKRICLARALLRDTEVLILDEPLANLDEVTAGRIEDLLLSIENKTLLVVSHQFSGNKLGAFDQVVELGA